jgi:TPR repeat protein
VSRPTIANQATITIDRSAFRSSSAADQQRLTAALGAYYRHEWDKAVNILKPANASDPNVQYVTALALLIPNSTDQVRDAQTLLRAAAAAGQPQAGAVLGRTLVAGLGGLPKDEAAGGKLIADGAQAGEAYAMRLAAAGYVTRASSGDFVKAVDLLRKAADAGDPVAMMQLAYCIQTGRGGLARDESKALDYLRRSAEAGYSEAQFTLARWITERYFAHETEDPSEGIKWYERAYQRGYSPNALVNLARLHRFARSTPWFDTKHSFELLQLCAPYSHGYCHDWLARAYHDGAGTPRDLVKAYAHYTIAKQLGQQDVAVELQKLDGGLLPAAKTSATELAMSISAKLKPAPRPISLQAPETESAGPSPWMTASAPPVTSPTLGRPSPAVWTAADWTACKGKEVESAIAACARLIGSGLTGKDLGLAHFYQGSHQYQKKQYQEAIAEYGKAIELGVNPAPAHNDRGIAYAALGNLDAALREYDEAISIDSSYALGYENRAYLHLLRNQLDEAMADANTAIGLTANRPRAFWVRAGINEARAQWNEVVSDCTTAIALSANYQDCFNRRGFAYFKLLKYDLALADLDEAVRLAPEWAIPRNNRAVLYEAMGNFEAAFRDYGRAAALGNVNAMFSLGVLYEKGQGISQNTSEAINWYQKAADRGNQDAVRKLQALR